MNKICPYRTFTGEKLHNGDHIIHPDGRCAKILYIDKGDDVDSWLCDYEDGSHLSRLCLQVGDKGRAVRLAIKEVKYESQKR